MHETVIGGGTSPTASDLCIERLVPTPSLK